MSKAYTLERLFCEYTGGICVPRIQRGYVQGRDDEKGKEIRANFVPALVDAVFKGNDLSLDFIYGVARDNGTGRRSLLPLDGQQRLSTVFLLAWLCGKWNREWRFAYESRRIPKLFVEGLCEHPFDGSAKPSLLIRDSAWFLAVWENDPTVAGMIRMLDALYRTIGSRNRSEADFRHVTFLLHGIDGNSETFDHIFRKMNARGKELSPWENLKAMLDKYLPASLADEWRDKVDGVWSEIIWKHVGGDIAKLDNAMEKVVRMVYARCAGSEAQKDSLWNMEMRIRGKADDGERNTKVFSPKEVEEFFRIAARYFGKLEQTASWWTDDRAKNALWGVVSDDGKLKFWDWLAEGDGASVNDLLRMSFLTEPAKISDAERRRRVLLNLLDASAGINRENFGLALSTGLDYLTGNLAVDGIGERKAGYSTEQLTDEERKWKLNENRIVSFEKDDLVYCGSLRFIGWSAFKDEDDIEERLNKIRNSINSDWLRFFCNVLTRLVRGSSNELESHVTIPFSSLKQWGRYVLSTSQGVKAIAEIETNIPEPKLTSWMWIQHFECLARNGKLDNNCGLRSFDGLTYLIAGTRRSKNSIRLDCNEIEKCNRELLKDETIKYEEWETRYSPRAAKVFGYGYDVWDSSWDKRRDPPIRRMDGELAIIATTPNAPSCPLDSIEKWRDAFCKIDGDTRHWKPGRSAQSLAEWVLSGEACKTIANELKKLAELKDDPVRHFDRAKIECPCPFDSYPNPRRQDIGIWGRTESGKTFFIGVEAKVDESFDRTLREVTESAKAKRSNCPSSQGLARIDDLCKWFGINICDDSICDNDANLRYQLLHFAKGTADVGDVDFRIMLLVTFQTDSLDSQKAQENIDDWNNFLKRFFVFDSGESHLDVPSEHNPLIALKIEVKLGNAYGN